MVDRSPQFENFSSLGQAENSPNSPFLTCQRMKWDRLQLLGDQAGDPGGTDSRCGVGRRTGPLGRLEPRPGLTWSLPAGCLEETARLRR